MNLFDRTPPAPQCPGLFGRYRRTAFVAGGRAVRHTEELRFLKRRSCTGCRECGGILEALTEFPEDLEFDTRLQDGDVAQLSIKVVSYDTEMPHIADDWHVFASKVTR